MDTPEIIRDAAATRRVRRYLDLAEQIKTLDEERKRILADLASSIGHNAIIDGHKLTLVIQQRVAYAEAFKALMPNANLTPWTSKTEFWRLT